MRHKNINDMTLFGSMIFCCKVLCATRFQYIYKTKFKYFLYMINLCNEVGEHHNLKLKDKVYFQQFSLKAYYKCFGDITWMDCHCLKTPCKQILLKVCDKCTMSS